LIAVIENEEKKKEKKRIRKERRRRKGKRGMPTLNEPTVGQ